VRTKLSTGKALVPGRKQVFRVENDGMADHDVLGRRDDEPQGRPLLERTMAGGKRLPAGRRTLDEARARAREETSRLPPRLRGLEPADPPYEVELSRALAQDQQALRREHERQWAPR
jgi:nicotinate phosphoribosyltransferase